MSEQINTWTPEMQAELAAMRGDVRRAISAHQQGKFQHILTAIDKGVADLGENAAAFLAIWACVHAVGIGCQEWEFYGLANFFNGARWTVAGATVATRVVVDLGLGELFKRKKKETALEPELQSTPQAPSAPVIMEMGLQVDDGRGGWVILLPGLPHHQVLKMAQRTAVGYLSGRVKKKNFSKRYLGRFWGDYLNDAKERLAAAGHIVIIEGNKTYTFTDSGVEWMEGVIDER